MATQVSLTDGAVASAGALAIQTNGTTQAVSISTGQVATLAQNPILTSGTANGVAYLNGSKAVTSGSALTFDGTNFATTGTASATKMIPTGGSATGNGMYLPASNTLAWSNNGSETMRLDSAGNLGLGVTPSAWGFSGQSAFQVKNASFAGYLNRAYVGANNYTNSGGSSIYIASDFATNYVQASGQHQWYNAASGTAGNAITFTQAMTLDASGNLGVGVTSMSNALEIKRGAGVNAYIEIAGNNNTPGSTSALYGQDSGNVAYCWNRANAPLLFGTNGSERVRITSGGDLLVAGTSTSGINSGGGFYVNANSLNTYTMTSHVTGSASGSPYAYFYYANSYLGQISQSGTTGVNYTSASDYRLKNITGPLTGAKEFIMALQPKQGTWKSDGSRFVGFLAHEFQEVSPSSVSGEKDAVDEDGNPIMQSMQASSPEVMANLVAFIQEQQALITQLQADVAALKGA